MDVGEIVKTEFEEEIGVPDPQSRGSEIDEFGDASLKLLKFHGRASLKIWVPGCLIICRSAVC